jgi:glycine hydroxymethyltransferase
MADIAHIAGLVATGLHPTPFGHCDFVTTTTHKTLRGPRGGMAFCKEEHAKVLDRSVFPGLQGGPLMHVVAAKAVALGEALDTGFADYQRRVVANAARLAGRIETKGFRIVSGGTDNHVFLVDVGEITGKVAEESLEAAGITVNKNTIPYDERPPLVASGVRIGTPALTTRGMGEAEMDRVGDLVAEVLADPESESVRDAVREKVEELTARFPLYDPLS